MSASAGCAPIVLFAYSRLEHLRRTVESLLKNEEASKTILYVFCDSPRYEFQRAQVDAVRAYVSSIEGFGSVVQINRTENLGLAKSIISGVTQILQVHDRVIVMEDDLCVSPHFLRYMNDGLNVYRDDEGVVSIHGYTFPVPERLPETFFIRGADCWGWATWRRAWSIFEPDGRLLLERLSSEGLLRAFDLYGAYPYTRMLSRQIEGKNDSWAVRWHASCFLENKLTLYPGLSLVDNIGADDSGTHCSATSEFRQMVSDRSISVSRIEIREDPGSAEAFRKFLARHTSIWARVVRLVRRYLSRLSV